MLSFNCLPGRYAYSSSLLRMESMATDDVCVRIEVESTVAVPVFFFSPQANIARTEKRNNQDKCLIEFTIRKISVVSIFSEWPEWHLPHSGISLLLCLFRLLKDSPEILKHSDLLFWLHQRWHKTTRWLGSPAL